jgi:hypothetical protein
MPPTYDPQYGLSDAGWRAIAGLEELIRSPSTNGDGRTALSCGEQRTGDGR